MAIAQSMVDIHWDTLDQWAKRRKNVTFRDLKDLPEDLVGVSLDPMPPTTSAVPETPVQIRLTHVHLAVDPGRLGRLA